LGLIIKKKAYRIPNHEESKTAWHFYPKNRSTFRQDPLSFLLLFSFEEFLKEKRSLFEQHFLEKWQETAKNFLSFWLCCSSLTF
jgi:hypothetical protein